MAYISCDKLSRSNFDNNVPAEDRMQDINLNQSKLKVNDTYKKDEKLTTKFEPCYDKDVVSKTYIDTKLCKIAGQISFIEKVYIEFNLLSHIQSVEEILIERTAKTIIEILFDTGLFDNYDTAVEVLKVYLFFIRRMSKIKPKPT